MRMHPDHLEKIANRVPAPKPDGNYNFTAAQSLSVVEQVATEVSKGLLFTEEEDELKWIENLGRLRFMVASWRNHPTDNGLPMAVVMSLIVLAKKAWVGPADAPVRPMPFIHDKELREIAQADVAAFEIALKTGLTKAALVHGGSAVEAMLIDVIQQLGAKVPHKLEHMIALCGEIGIKDKKGNVTQPGLKILSDRIERMADGVRSWRNLVHPAVLKKHIAKDALHPAEARASQAFVEKVIATLEARHNAAKPPP